MAASVEPDLDLIRREVSQSQLVLCADGGYTLCRQAGLFPHAVIGDLDSIAPEDLASLGGHPVQIHRFPRDKDESDLELTLFEAHRRGATSVRILAALGGRLDHTLFNVISILGRAHALGLEATLVSSSTEARMFLGGPPSMGAAGGARDGPEIHIEDRVDWICSLIPISDRVDGIVLKGFRYPLDNESLHQNETRGLSNVVLDARASISVGSGKLLSLFIRPSLDP